VPQQPVFGGFGAPLQQPAFGTVGGVVPPAQNVSGLFGTPAQNAGGLFGTPAQNAGSIFGAPLQQQQQQARFASFATQVQLQATPDGGFGTVVSASDSHGPITSAAAIVPLMPQTFTKRTETVNGVQHTFETISASEKFANFSFEELRYYFNGGPQAYSLASGISTGTAAVAGAEVATQLSRAELVQLIQLLLGDTVPAMIASCFEQLDRDRDGVLTEDDFKPASHEPQLGSLDVRKLYADDRNRAPSLDTLPPLLGPSMDGSAGLPATGPLLMRVDSSFATVSQPTALPSADDARSYAALEDAETEMTDLVKRCADILDVGTETSLALLMHYRWDVGHTIDTCLANERKARAEVGLGPRSRPLFYRFDKFASESSTSVCGICFCEAAPEDLFSLSCRHWYCRTCWNSYITTETSNRNVMMQCPHEQCSQIVTQTMVEFLCDERDSNAYKTVVLKR
jgi:hypothetical protein